MDAREHSYMDITQKIKLLEDDMFIYTIDGQRVGRRELEEKINKLINNYCICIFSKEKYINTMEFKKECKKWTGKQKGN